MRTITTSVCVHREPQNHVMPWCNGMHSHRCRVYVHSGHDHVCVFVFQTITQNDLPGRFRPLRLTRFQRLLILHSVFHKQAHPLIYTYYSVRQFRTVTVTRRASQVTDAPILYSTVLCGLPVTRDYCTDRYLNAWTGFCFIFPPFFF